VKPLTIAIPKGRVLERLVAVLVRAGFDVSELESKDRRLIRQSSDGVQFLLLKPDDVPTYVEYGAAALGIVGRDILLERRYDLYEPLDLGIGRCRMVVAGPRGRSMPDVPRIATKYPRVTGEFFASRGMQAEVIFVQGSVEIAPLTGLADFIVDLVETGTTLKDHDLVVFETISEISSVVVANRSLFKLRHADVSRVLERLRDAVSAGGA
jgi:ATP phosphoribosyltransferase